MRIYLDVCCLNRPFDDQTQPRIRLETDAVLVILRRLESEGWLWIGSEVLKNEIHRTPDVERMARVDSLTKHVHQVVDLDSTHIARAAELAAMGFGAADALHIACAEDAGVDVLLTTDDRLLKAAERGATRLRVAVKNPLRWLQDRGEI